MRNTVPGWRPWRAWSFLFALPSIPRAEALSSKGFFFTGEGVGVVIRSVGVDDLVKTAFWFGRLRLYLLQSSDTRLSESQAEAEELNQSQSLGTCVIGLSFPFSLGLRQSGLHWIVSARIIRGVGRKCMETFWFFRLRLRHTYDSEYDWDFWFSQGHERSYDFAYESDFDSVPSESQR